MKIFFPLVRASSGSDVWTYTLARALQEQGVATEVRVFPHVYQYDPRLLGRRISDDADIVHANSWNAFAFAGQRPLIATVHHLVHDPVLRRYQTMAQNTFHRLCVYPFEKRSMQAAARVTAVSRYTQDRVRETFGRESLHIPNGIDIDLFRPDHPPDPGFAVPDDKIVLFFAGNFSRRKGADLLAPIMNRLGNRFHLICSGGLRGKGDFPMDNVTFTSRLTLTQLVACYTRCDIFLFPSRLEGFGLSVAEAMACGKPVVTSRASALPELVIDGQGGYLCEIDRVDAFAEKITLLGENAGLRRQYGEFNRQRIVEHFSLRQMAAHYVRLYEETLANPR